MAAYALSVEGNVQSIFSAAIQSTEKGKGKVDMEDEMHSLQKNET